MPDLFKEYLKSILETNKDYMQSEDDEKTYLPFILNRALSQNQDTIAYANIMNTYSFLPKKMQYDYLRKAIRKWKRPFQERYKYNEPSDLEMIKKYYQVSSSKAMKILNLLNKDQLKHLRKLNDIGGKK